MNIVTKFASKPVIRGIVLGLGLMFVTEGIKMMLVSPWLGGIGLVLTFVLLTWQRFPAMFALLILGAGAVWVLDPAGAQQLLAIPPHFRIPEFTFARMSWGDFVKGSLLLAIPQFPLTIGNAVIAIRAENNERFPDRPITDRMMTVSQGVMNLVTAPFGGIPLCHGAGGMAGWLSPASRCGTWARLSWRASSCIRGSSGAG